MGHDLSISIVAQILNYALDRVLGDLGISINFHGAGIVDHAVAHEHTWLLGNGEAARKHNNNNIGEHRLQGIPICRTPPLCAVAPGVSERFGVMKVDPW